MEVDDIGSIVLVWGWEWKDGKVKGVGGMAMVHGEEQRFYIMEQLIEVCKLDFYDEIYFQSLVWHLSQKEPKLFEDIEHSWEVLYG